jgi:predicted nucleic acid-binding protein
MYLLDTCVLSELIKPAPHPSVVDWLNGHDEQLYFLSVLTLGEIEKGISKLPESKKKKRIRAWFEKDMRHRFEGRVLDVDAPVALEWGREYRPKRRGNRFRRSMHCSRPRHVRTHSNSLRVTVQIWSEQGRPSWTRGCDREVSKAMEE